MNMLLSAFTGQCFQKVAEVGGRNVELLCKICYRWYADIYQYFRIKILPDLFFKSVQKVRLCLIPGDELPAVKSVGVSNSSRLESTTCLLCLSMG